MAKKVTSKKEEAVKLDPSKVFEFVVSKDSKHLKKGMVYTLDGAMAELLVNKGLGAVK
jgi:hypothetical protein